MPHCAPQIEFHAGVQAHCTVLLDEHHVDAERSAVIAFQERFEGGGAGRNELRQEGGQRFAYLCEQHSLGRDEIAAISP